MMKRDALGVMYNDDTKGNSLIVPQGTVLLRSTSRVLICATFNDAHTVSGPHAWQRHQQCSVMEVHGGVWRCMAVWCARGLGWR